MVSVLPEDLYLYCKVDSEEQKRLAESLADSAEEALFDKNITLTDQNKLRFGLCVKAMTLHELDHPGEELPRGIRGMINALKFSRKR